MSDNLRRYRAIRDALTQGYPGHLTGTVAWHVRTLAALISGIVAGKSTQLPHIATQVPDGTQAESRVQRFARWERNDKITTDVYVVPYAKMLLAQLAVQTLVLVIDGSVVGRGCVALMMYVVYKGRALPLAWQVRQGKTGHVPEDLHIALVQQVHTLIPRGGRRWCCWGMASAMAPRSGTPWQDYHWSYVVRTGSTLLVMWDGERFRCETVAACIKPGTLVALTDVHVTAAAYDPVLLLYCWAKGYKEPLHLLTNMASAEEACRLYAQRFRIETFFADQKSRGFHLHQSHLADPTRLSRLLIAACLAYI